MKQTIIAFIVTVSVAFALPEGAYAETTLARESNDSIAQKLMMQREAFPQEKVHVMTDRDMYVAGDTLWLRGWITDALSLHPVDNSKYLYVELRNGKDELYKRIKLIDRKGSTHGYIFLDENLPTEEMTLVAYTYYMAGQSELYFFKKNIMVTSLADATSGNGYSNMEQTIASNESLHPRIDLRHGTTAEQASATISADSEIYGQREKVTLKVNAPEGSRVAISVTDDGLTATDETSAITNILAQQPLMFGNVNDLTDSIITPTGAYEQGAEVSGRLYRTFNKKKPLADRRVELMIPAYRYADIKMSDKNGRFSFNGFDYPDSTVYMVRSLTKYGKYNDNISIDADNLPATVCHLQPYKRAFDYQPLTIASDVKMRDAMMQKIYGMKYVTLQDIIVRGKKKKVNNDISIYDILARNVIDEDFIISRGIDSFEKALHFIPGLYLDGHNIWHRTAQVGIFIDGICIDTGNDGYKLIDNMYSFHDIESIYFMPRSSSLILGAHALNGAVCIKLKTGASATKHNFTAFPEYKIFMPLGYQSYIPFTAPNYSQTRESVADDYRVTLLWKPDVTIGSGGESSVSFFTSDNTSTTYTVRVDGVAPDGQLIHSKHKIFIK